MIRRFAASLLACLATVSSSASAESGDWARVGPDGGGLCAVVAAPGDPTRVYAGSGNGGGGVYRSDDGGRSWELANLGLPYRNPICVLGVDPLDADWGFTLTYPVDVGGWPNQVWVSVNGGRSWTAKGALPNGRFVHDVLVIREQGGGAGRTLLATADDGVLWSTDDGSTWNAASGLPGGGYRTVADLAADPFDARGVFAAIEQGGVFVSRDGGRSFSGVNRGFRRPLYSFTGVTADPARAGRFWATVSEGGRFEVYRTSDGGGHWLPSRRGFGGGTFLGSVVPLGGDRLLAAVSGAQLQLLRSADAGLTWRPTGNLPPPSFQIQRVGSELLAQGGRGLARSNDLGAHWQDSVRGLRGGTVLALTVDDTAAGALALVAAPQGFARTLDAGQQWSSAGGGDLVGPLSFGQSFASAPGRPRRLALATTHTDEVGGFLPYLDLATSSDRGGHWQRVTAGFCAAPAGVVISPRNANHILLDGYRAHPRFCPEVCGTYRSLDGGTTLECLEPLLPEGRAVHQLAFDPVDGSLYGRSAGGALIRSTDDGDHWEVVHPTVAPVLTFDPSTPGTVYGVQGFDPVKLLKTTDGGASWRPLETLPVSVPAGLRLAPDPRRPGHLFAATSERVFETVDGGASWFDLSDGLSAVAGGYVTAFAVGPAAQATSDGLTLYLGTVGSGLLARSVDAPVVCGTIAGLACSTGRFCDLPVGQCSTSDLAGVCRPQPAACIEIFDPVCGCDGSTYANDCLRQRAGTALDHPGAC